MNLKKLKELVVKEATNLKESATTAELARLDFDTLNHRYFDTCIYGQMTGDCFGSRAFQLLKECTTPYSCGTREFVKPELGFTDEYTRSFSPIEFYISQPDAQNDMLVAYLKGDIPVLTVDQL